MTPKVSVIVPVYKAAAYLHRCVDSILDQTFQNFEVLLIDDGSPDSSGEICDEYAKKDGRVHVYHKKNGGVSSARNLGIEQSRGEWISFIDSDDYVDNMYLDIFHHILNDFDIIHFGFKKQTELGCYTINYQFAENEINSEIFFSDTFFSSCCISYFFKRMFLLKNTIKFDTSLRYSEDRLFIIKSALLSKKNILLINNTSYIYSYNPSSAVNVKRNFDDSIADLMVLEKLCKDSFIEKQNDITLYLTMLLLNSFIYVYSLQCIDSIKMRKEASLKFKEVIANIPFVKEKYHSLFVTNPLIVIIYRKLHYKLVRLLKPLFKS